VSRIVDELARIHEVVDGAKPAAAA
jgi:hypothetical protein